MGHSRAYGIPFIPQRDPGLTLAGIILSQLKNDSSKPISSAVNGKSVAQPTTFLASQNPDQVKRNVLSSFKDALLLPVTIIPRTAVYVVTAGSTAAVSGLSMLNPNKWTGSGAITPASASVSAPGSGPHGKSSEKVDNAMVFELGDDEDEAHSSTRTCNELHLLPFQSTPIH